MVRMFERLPHIATFRGGGQHYIRPGSKLARSFSVFLDGNKLDDTRVAKFDCNAGLVWPYELSADGRKIIVDAEPVISLNAGRIETRWNDG